MLLPFDRLFETVDVIASVLCGFVSAPFMANAAVGKVLSSSITHKNNAAMRFVTEHLIFNSPFL